MLNNVSFRAMGNKMENRAGFLDHITASRFCELCSILENSGKIIAPP